MTDENDNLSLADQVFEIARDKDKLLRRQLAGEVWKTLQIMEESSLTELRSGISVSQMGTEVKGALLHGLIYFVVKDKDQVETVIRPRTVKVNLDRVEETIDHGDGEKSFDIQLQMTAIVIEVREDFTVESYREEGIKALANLHKRHFDNVRVPFSDPTPAEMFDLFQKYLIDPTKPVIRDLGRAYPHNSLKIKDPSFQRFPDIF